MKMKKIIVVIAVLSIWGIASSSYGLGLDDLKSLKDKVNGGSSQESSSDKGPGLENSDLS